MGTQGEKPSGIPSPEIIDQLNVQLYQVDIFRAALEMQLWAKVAQGYDTAEALAASQGWDPLGTRMLLDDICSLKLLHRDGDRYCLVPEAVTYLLPGKETFVGTAFLAEYGWEGDGGLAEAIRTGKRPVGYRATTPEAIDTWLGIYAYSLADLEAYLHRSESLWQASNIQGRDGLRVLDVACGPAPKTFFLARQHPGVRITLLDWERVLKTTCRVAAKLGIDGQITTLPGDMWSTEFGSNQFDVAFLGSITHFLGPEENVRLFSKVQEALVRGGALVVNAMRREYPDPMSPELWFYAVSASGAVCDFGEYRDMLERAGFIDVQDVSQQPIKAIKP